MKVNVVTIKVANNLEMALDSLVEYLGGWPSVAPAGEIVVLKPNLVAPRHARTGATTSLELLGLFAARLRDHGARPAIFETPGMEYRMAETWRFFDLPSLARSHGAELLSAQETDWVSVKIPGGRVLKKARVHRAALEHHLINLPKLKTHIVTGATLAMKNLMGLCHDDTKRAMHILGIHGSIVDLNRLIHPTFNVIDGTIGMQGDGAVYGIPKDVGMLLASPNPLAVDLVGLELMGLGVEAVPHLRFALREFGVPALGRLGDLVVPERFLAPRPSKVYLLAYRLLYVVDTWFYRFNGMHFNEYLYRRGFAGTRPYIVKEECDGCGACFSVCPSPESLDVKRKRIRLDTCLRCLECVDACARGALIMKGISGNKKDSHCDAGAR